VIRCRSSRTLILAVPAIVVIAAAGLAACGGSTPPPAPTVTVTVPPSSASPTTSASPSAKPAVKKQLTIAVASGSATNGISVIGSSGQVKQLVAPHGGPVSDLAWSPDGTRLAYLQAKSVDDPTSTVWVYDTATGKTRSLAGDSAAFTWVGPTQLIVAAISTPMHPYRTNGPLYVVDVTKSTRTLVKNAAGHTLRGANPTASADGTLVAYVHYNKATGGMIPEQLLLYDADTLAVSEVTHGGHSSDTDGDSFSFPSLSPDGSLIYACQTGGDPGFRCIVYRVNGSKVYSSPPLAWPTNGAWDTKSARLAFGGGSAMVEGLPGAINVWQVGSAKAKQILSWSHSNVGSWLAWTPLGKQIVYSVPTAGLNGDIWVVNADGTNRHKLLHNGGYPACTEAPIEFP
jgi:Tol biopolymer transport system component